MGNVNKSDSKLARTLTMFGGIIAIGLGVVMGLIGGILAAINNENLTFAMVCWILSFTSGLFGIIGSGKLESNKTQGVVLFSISLILAILYLIYVYLLGNGIIDDKKHTVYMITFFVEGTAALLFATALIVSATSTPVDNKVEAPSPQVKPGQYQQYHQEPNDSLKENVYNYQKPDSKE